MAAVTEKLAKLTRGSPIYVYVCVCNTINNASLMFNHADKTLNLNTVMGGRAVQW